MIQFMAYGGGTNSVAMLVGLKERNEKLYAILFADTGGEKPHTYQHIEFMQGWCKENGFPQITACTATWIELTGNVSLRMPTPRSSRWSLKETRLESRTVQR